MPLLGEAVMVLWYDITPDAVSEHDAWHTHEHMPERLAIPGFMRGTRWVSLSGSPRYFVMYEVRNIDTLTSAPYLDRLNSPTPWSSKMMSSFHGMTRGFCSIKGSFGMGVGQTAISIRFSPVAGAEDRLRERLTKQVLPGLSSKQGLASAHLLEAVLAPQMTREQEIRGRDAAVDWVLLVTGYSSERVMSLSDKELHAERIARYGALHGQVAGIYRLEFSISDREAVSASIHRTGCGMIHDPEPS